MPLQESGLPSGSDRAFPDGRTDGCNGNVVVILGQWLTAPDGLSGDDGDDMVGLQKLDLLLRVFGRVSCWKSGFIRFFLAFFRAKMFYAPIHG